MTTAAVHRPPRYTSEQSRAIETQHVSVSLSAGAGCGKTFVLTERFLSCFDPAIPGSLGAGELGQVVAITFTERAAREMRDRVRQKCHERLATAATPQRVEHWTALLRGLDAARISTIHSFCGWLLRARAAEAGIDPNFDVLEQAQADALLSRAIDDELRRLIAARDALAIRLAVRFDLSTLGDMLHGLVVELEEGRVDAWLDRDVAEQLACWEAFHCDTVLPLVARRLVCSPEARAVVEVLRRGEPTNPVMRQRRRVLLDKLSPPAAQAFSAPGLARELDEIRRCAQVQGGGRAASWPSAEAYESFRDAAARLRGTIDKLRNSLTFDPQQALEAATVGRELLTLTAVAADRYAKQKRALAAMDFGDLLREARKLLVDPRHAELRSQLGAQIRLLLIDEFQDTDPLQVDLVEALCGAALSQGKLFFVGDPKQSIYRFRGADPRVFRKLRVQTPDDGRLSLTRNFRSQPAILEFVNALFRDELEDYEPLRADRPQANSAPCVEFLWAPAASPNESRESLLRREADWIARRVRGFLDSGQCLVGDEGATDKAVLRPARPGDVAILFRALSDVQFYEHALRAWGIDYYLVGGHAFYAQQEIFDLINLLRAIANPGDALSLAGALRSGFFSLADETLFWLARHPGGLPGGLAAAAYPPEMAPDEQHRARFAATTLESLRARKDRLPSSQLIEEALALTGYDAALVNEFFGDRKLANLRKFIELARGFDARGFFTLGDFTNQLALFVARQPQEALAATLGENMNAVRLMTIHQAKGLEFPIVIVPDVDRPKFHQLPRAHLDPRLGPLVKLNEDDAEAPASGYDLWRFVETQEELAELARLLYVATTRAADYLILSGCFQTLGEGKAPWTRLLSSRFELLSGRLVAPLPSGEPCPAITVTTDEPPVAASVATRGSKLDIDDVIDACSRAQPGSSSAPGLVEPIPPDFAAGRRYSFSRLAGTLTLNAEPAAEWPEGQQAAIDARALGTLAHAVLAAIDFSQHAPWRPLVELHAGRLLVDGSAEIGDATVLVGRFLDTPRARELAAAAESMAEVEFLLAWPPDGFDGEHAGISLGGFMDRLYRDAHGRWHVLDFKTNRVAPGGLPRQAAAYELQMLVYGLATERILGSSPTSLVLHFLRTGEEHAFPWNDAARERCLTLVAEAIAADIAQRRRAWEESCTYRPLDGVL